jgi:hypothetical protein
MHVKNERASIPVHEMAISREKVDGGSGARYRQQQPPISLAADKHETIFERRLTSGQFNS